MIDSARVQRELQEFSKHSKDSGVTVEPKSDDLVHLIGTISGPMDSPYEGGTFQIDITLPDEYPFYPPKMRFMTRVWHPNVSSQNGAICLDILKDKWSPAITLRTALLSLQALLSAPVPEDPQDAIVAEQYLKNHEAFVATARCWTSTYANGPSPGDDVKIKSLMEMGFPEDLVRTTLESVGGDDSLALEKLILSGSKPDEIA